MILKKVVSLHRNSEEELAVVPLRTFRSSEGKAKFHFDFAESRRKAAKYGTNFAEIAQLVEHDLAKVGVASSSLVFRSKIIVADFLEQRAQC